jgi:hypothetical protein
MKYVLLICDQEASEAASADGSEPLDDGPDIETWLEETGARRLLGAQLAQPTDAVTVRRRKGETVLTDGPYAETKEWIVGFDLIECEDMEEAIQIASRHPVARFGMVEVRPYHPSEQ